MAGKRRRRGFRRESGVYTHPAQVPGTISRRKGKIQLGKAPRRITGLKEGAMTNHAMKLGYISEGETISDIPNSKIDDFARDLAKKVGATRAGRMFNAQINLRTNQPGGFRNKMVIAKGAIRKRSIVLKPHHQKTS